MKLFSLNGEALDSLDGDAYGLFTPSVAMDRNYMLLNIPISLPFFLPRLFSLISILFLTLVFFLGFHPFYCFVSDLRALLLTYVTYVLITS